MLQTIDLLIGFSVVMLILSAIVTMLVQWITASLLNLKGRVLKEGVAHLLALLDKHGLTARETQQIADHILRNSLVGKKKLFREKRGLAGVIHREELTKLILDFAAGADLTEASKLEQGQGCDLDGEALLRARLLNSLKNNGIVDRPEDILKAVRSTMLVLEQNQPELANDVRQSLALLTHASSEFLAKLNAWFDQTIDRTVESFTGKTRIWTVLTAALVAVFFQVDSFELIHRLSTDKEATATLVEAAITNPDHFKPVPLSVDEPPPAATAKDLPDPSPSDPPAPDAASGYSSAQALEAIKNDPDLKLLVDTNLIAWPKNATDWRGRWTIAPDDKPRGHYGLLVHLVGLLLTVSLLAMGAPLWYEILKNLIQLRSVVARKDDAQRETRQTSQERSEATASRAGPAASLPIATGERGDLDAVG